jgi:hypothetical protein
MPCFGEHCFPSKAIPLGRKVLWSRPVANRICVPHRSTIRPISVPQIDVGEDSSVSAQISDVKRSLAVRYRDIDFDINEFEPSKWRWVIYQRIASDPAIRDKTSYDTRDEAIVACRQAIDTKFAQKKGGK